MNILFLIGNGFDLNIGLKTKYSDFYEYYKSQNSSNSKILTLKNDISSNILNWSDLELALGLYSNNWENLEDFDKVFEDIKDKLAEFLSEQENQLASKKFDKNKFLQYLIYPERQFSQTDRDLLNLFKSKWRGKQWNIDIVTFNYTNLIETILGDDKINLNIGPHKNGSPIILKKISHIHGFLSHDMVLGVNDLSQVGNPELCDIEDFREAFIKSECNKVQKHKRELEFEKSINSSNLIYIFGSSIGETDSIWWELIGKQLKKDCKLVIFTKAEEIAARHSYKRARVERAMKNFFFERAKISEDERQPLMEKVFIGINSTMFSGLAES
jgi:hypothetical protein